MAASWYFDPHPLMPAGQSVVLITRRLFDEDVDHQLWILHHECVHLRMMAGPFNAAWRFCQSSESDVAYQVTLGHCGKQQAGLALDLLGLIQEIPVEKYSRHYAADRFVFQANRYLPSDEEPLDSKAEQLRPYWAFLRLVRTELGLLLTDDVDNRNQMLEMRRHYGLAVREAGATVAAWLLYQRDRLLAIDPDRRDPNIYDEVYRTVLAVQSPA